MTKGKNAVITGSTSGIGLGIAEAMAGAGMNVMLNGFGDPAEIEAARADLAARHDVAVGYHGADMTKPEDIADLVSTAAGAFGSVDVLFWSTTPAFKTWRRSRTSRPRSGTPSWRSTCRAPFTRSDWRCRP
jgi:NAD(P)-dependent dehydrogenase (short-subunit alcohol dehydrogenase family)